MGLNWRPDDDFCDFLTILRESKDIPEELHKVREVPQQNTIFPKAKPDISAEDLGVEDYSEEDLNKPNAKVKSKSQKDPKYAVRKVADKEVQNPVPLKDATQTVTEGIFELLGEVPGISLTDQAAVKAAVRSGKILVDWPPEEEMIDALSKLEDFVDPAKLGPDVDIKQAYLTHIIVPKALVWDKTRECKEDLRQPLYLCNNCCKTFRANEAVCPECLSNIVERVTGNQSSGGEENNIDPVGVEHSIAKRIRAKNLPILRGERHVPNVTSPKTYDFWIEGDVWEGGFDLQKRTEFRNTFSLLPSGKIVRNTFAQESKQTKTGKNLQEKAYHVYCTLGRRGKTFIVDAEDKEKAKDKIKRRYPDAVVDMVVEEEVKVAEKKIEETRFVVYFTAEGQGKHLEIPAENKEAAEAEIKRICPDASILRIVEESRLGEDFEEEHGLGKGQDAKNPGWDLTFKYPHNQLTGNPLLNKNGEPWLWERHPIDGRRVRVFSDYQAAWVEKHGAIPVREKPAEEPSKSAEEPSAEEPKLAEQEAEVKAKSYTVVGRGLDEIDAKNIAQQKEGSSVVPDDQNEGKFMIMTKVKESKLKEEYKPKVMRSKMIDVMYDLGYHLAGEKKDSDAGIRVLEFRKGDDVVEIKLSLEEEKE